jgi:hypothetical protein
MGLEKMNFTNLKFEILKILRDLFILDFFHFKCYGSAMCGGKNL